MPNPGSAHINAATERTSDAEGLQLDAESIAIVGPRSVPDGELVRISEIGEKLLAGTSLNRLNRQVLSFVNREISSGNSVGFDQTALKEWCFFAISNQNYCSPTRSRENAVFHDGIIRISDQIRYLRSELNCPVFGDPYERNVVAIRNESAESFARFAARYVTCNGKREILAQDYSVVHFDQILNEARKQEKMVLIELRPENTAEFAGKLAAAIREDSVAGGAFYLRVAGTFDAADREAVAKSIIESGSPAHVILEEIYNPLALAELCMRKVTFLHNQRDPLRYQLLQDAASLGYRVDLRTVVESYFEAGRLPEILNTESKSEDRIPRGYREKSVGGGVDPRLERNADYGVLLNTISGVRGQLAELRGGSTLDAAILLAVSSEAKDLEDSLRSVLLDETAPISAVSETFHKGYYRLRTLVQYSARLGALLAPESRESLEKRIAAIEGGEVVTTKSGMSAARAVVTYLGDRVDRIYSGSHYWETDFLVENSFATNPHYPEMLGRQVSRVISIPCEADHLAIDRHVEEMVNASASTPHGQVVCLDKSVSPFFYTRSFNLEYFAKGLSRQAARLNSPVYLIVDNTLDLTISAATLFPEGVPKNVFLVFTPSHAKLHQLGFDFTTGGMINIHSHPQQGSDARQLRDALESALRSEGGLQEAQSLRLLLATFYNREEPGTFPAYYSYMVGKRQRNTRALMKALSVGLAEHVRTVSAGEWKALAPVVVIDPDLPAVVHHVALTFHYDPNSSLHGYITLLEPPTDSYIAGKIFEEMKRRIFKIAATEGLQLGDGTSWGFPTTRLDWYMHTMRIAVGVEHLHTLSRLGAIISSVLKEFIEFPGDFLSRVETSPMFWAIKERRIEEIMELDRLIPQDRQTPQEYYLNGKVAAWDYSFIVEDNQRIDAMLYAWPERRGDEQVIYLSKAATAPSAQGQGYFRRMLEHLVDRARADGFDTIVLNTSASKKNLGVIRAYEKCGFEVKGLEARMLDNGWPLIKVRMELAVGKRGPLTPFAPVSDSVYQRIHDSGNLEELAGAVSYPVTLEPL
jgi:ribosomal protein S18 acetylase RimI-like enzyme